MNIETELDLQVHEIEYEYRFEGDESHLLSMDIKSVEECVARRPGTELASIDKQSDTTTVRLKVCSFQAPTEEFALAVHLTSIQPELDEWGPGATEAWLNERISREVKHHDNHCNYAFSLYLNKQTQQYEPGIATKRYGVSDTLTIHQDGSEFFTDSNDIRSIDVLLTVKGAPDKSAPYMRALAGYGCNTDAVCNALVNAIGSTSIDKQPQFNIVVQTANHNTVAVIDSISIQPVVENEEELQTSGFWLRIRDESKRYHSTGPNAKEFAFCTKFRINETITGHEDPIVALEALGLPAADLIATLCKAIGKAQGAYVEDAEGLIQVLSAYENGEDED